MAIVACRVDGVITYATPFAARLLGCEELLGADLGQLVAAKHEEAVVRYLARLAAAEPTRSISMTADAAGSPRRTLEVLGVNRLEHPLRSLVLALSDVSAYAQDDDEMRLRVATAGVTQRRALDEIVHELEDLEDLRARNEALLVESRTDALSGLPNRRSYDEDLPVLDAAARHNRGYAVVFIDLDRFGRINRTDGGQDAGDDTLRAAATAFASAVRIEDRVYRLGGEEFVALLDAASAVDALVVAERMRAGLLELRLPHPDQPFVTASMGIAAFDPARHPDAQAVVHAADLAMNHAKESGRDRIVIATADGLVTAAR